MEQRYTFFTSEDGRCPFGYCKGRASSSKEGTFASSRGILTYRMGGQYAGEYWKNEGNLWEEIYKNFGGALGRVGGRRRHRNVHLTHSKLAPET